MDTEIYFGKINTGHDITGQQFKMMTIRNISMWQQMQIMKLLVIH